LLANLKNSTAFLPNDRNTFLFDSTNTTFIAVNMFNTPNHAVGVCELEVWTPPVSGPIYYAVDALLTNAQVVNDAASLATGNGAVVGGLDGGSVVALSGIESNGGRTSLALSFANDASNYTSVEVSVNQVPQTNITLGGTGGKYMTGTAEVNLAAGKNFVTLLGGASQLRIETINISAAQ
jgi:hypothetical protein